MRVTIADLKFEAGLHKTVPLLSTLEPVDFGGLTFHFDHPVTGEAEIWNTGDELLVRARIVGEALVQCSRCLTPFTLPLKVRFEEEFLEGEPQVDEDNEDLENDRTVTYFHGDAIDLTDAIRENVLLELPMKPLCQEDCKGLCPTCGTNRNESLCNCTDEAKVIDPRLAVFKDLLRKPDSNP